MDLTPQQLQEKHQVKQGYASFWDNIAFKREWAKPHFPEEHVDYLLDQAATLVVLLRDKIQKKSKIPIDWVPKVGAAIEYLWSVDYDPVQESNRFVRDLVHATFSDSAGYIQDLTEKDVDNYMKQVSEEKIKHRETMMEKIKESFQKINDLLIVNKDRDEIFDQHVLNKVLTKLKSTEQLLESSTRKWETLQEPKEKRMEKEKEEKKKKQEELQKAQEEAQKKAAEEKEKKMKEEEELKRQKEEKLKQKQKYMLKIQQVAHDVEDIKSNIKTLAEDTSHLSLADLSKDVSQGQQLVEKLENQCNGYITSLMTDLTSLDQLVGDEEIRPYRKEQVKAVQELMTDVDSVNEKLRNLLSQLRTEQKHLQEEQKKKEEETKEEAEEEDKMQEEKQPVSKPEEESKMEIEQEPPKKEEEEQPPKPKKEKFVKWRALKLNPQFEVMNRPDSMIVAAYIPGIKEEDLQIMVDKGLLTIQGLREPTPDEEISMVKQINALKKMDPSGFYLPQDVDEDSLLLRVGAGRFGHFKETYRIPRIIDVDNITASYENGVLQINLPKLALEKSKPKKPKTFNEDEDIWW